MAYKPSGPFITPAFLQIPERGNSYAVNTKSYPSPGNLIYVRFRTFGGTEAVSNGALSVVNTAVVETWYRPDITADCRLMIGTTPYEIIGEPENIEMRNQYLLFKVRAVKGGA